jgi:hypothetical protein
MRNYAFCTLLLALPACGGDGLAINAGDGGGSHPDLSMAVKPPDLAAPIPDLTMSPIVDMARPIPTDDGGPMCGPMTCQKGDVCCVTRTMGQLSGSCMSSCPDAAFTVQCDGPENCGGNPCCVSVAFMGFTPVFNDISCSQSPMDCQPVFNLGMNGQTRLCHTNADCTNGAPNSGANTCCTATFMGVTSQLCLPAQAAGFMGITCP